MRFWNFRNDAEQPEDGALSIEGVLVADEGWFSDGTVCAKDFRAQLAKYRNVTVTINSPGGDVMAGAELYSALREHSASGRGRVTVKVTALAASAASVVAMAGDEVLMSPAAYMMIHNPWSFMAGNADELRHEADVLDEIAEGIITAYEIKTGKSRAKLREMMRGESYMSARRCVKEGFADGLLYETEGTGNRQQGTGEEDPEDDPEDEGVLMRAGDYGMRAALAKAEAHGMTVGAWRNAETREAEQRRAELARRAALMAKVYNN